MLLDHAMQYACSRRVAMSGGQWGTLATHLPGRPQNTVMCTWEWINHYFIIHQNWSAIYIPWYTWQAVTVIQVCWVTDGHWDNVIDAAYMWSSGFEFCVFVVGWRHALWREWPTVSIIITSGVALSCAFGGVHCCWGLGFAWMAPTFRRLGLASMLLFISHPCLPGICCVNDSWCITLGL